MKLWTLTAAMLILFGMTASSEANIASSKHNLSASGTGTIKAISETELCVFCHIPHNAKPEAPLWNRTVTTAAYTMYNSDYLTRAGYTMPADVGQRSRLCLSCHDGTVAVGSVYTVRGVAGPITMTGVDGAGKMLSTAAGYLGADLSNDHPVSIKYDTGTFITIGTRGMELNATAPSINPTPYTGVKLYGTASGTIKGYVECTSCHDPHNDTNPDFLVVSNESGALCKTCHAKTGWTASIHATSAVTVANPAGETQPIPAGSISQAACMACHKNHSGFGIPYLLRKAEENTCFSPANAGTSPTAASCHGTNTTVSKNNLQTVLGRTRVHPTIATSGKHKNLDVLDYTLLGTGNRHAECPDCHNPHQATNLPHRVAASSWYPSSITSTSNLTSNSGALVGVPGVTPGAATIWTARTTYTVTAAATYEYEICYKCHSFYAIRNASTPVASWTGPSGASITDQAWEFNTANRSGHPVEVTLNSRTGSPAPKPLAANQLNTAAPNWSVNRGNQTMYCSDCHGADNENSTTDPNGPHGSNSLFMLKGLNKTWPGGFTLSNALTGAGTAAGLFCLNCHPIKSGTSTFYNNVHSYSNHRSTSITCVRCHTAVPHGSRLSRLIAYATPVPPWGAPYGNQSWLRGFKKAATPTGYSVSYCQIITPTPTGCGSHSGAVSSPES
jgi:predicted CXXCH cytochrome family protein